VANIVLNIALGRMSEWYFRVDTNDPANCALVIVVLATAGVETDAVIRDKDTLDAVIGAGAATNEVTNGGYARKVLTDTDIVAFAPDDTNDRVDLDIPDQTWTSVLAGDGWNDILICFDNDTTAGNDTNIVPGTLHDFVLVPDGSNVTAQISSTGFFRAVST
jgi:hypothetical protein